MPSQHADEPLRPFDQSTMSGIPPGTRTAVYHRLRIADMNDSDRLDWLTLAWHNEPKHVAAFDSLMPEKTSQPWFELESTEGWHFLEQLLSLLDRQHRNVRICGTCQHWYAVEDFTADRLPLGQCALAKLPSNNKILPDSVQRDILIEATRTQLAAQSCLALDCSAWSPQDEDASSMASPESISEPPGKPAAELPAKGQKFVQRVRKWIPWLSTEPDERAEPRGMINEQSGLGAGTEPCPICQGRIANLGSVMVDSPDGDEETLSVWRCRNCHTLYLNDWIDRWGRLASLETEEWSYRISPIQAANILYEMRHQRDDQRENATSSRNQQRNFILHIVGNARPIVHQTKLGR